MASMEISEAGVTQKLIIRQKLSIEELRSARVAKEELDAARAVLAELEERLKGMLPETDKVKKDKRKKKEVKEIDEKKKKPTKKKKDDDEPKEPPVAHVELTPPGEKKILGPMAEKYNAAAVESAWYAWWERCGFFHTSAADVLASGKKPFVIVLPPPNVTGSLHLGHGLTTAVQDTIVRWRRMRGEPTVWVPGVDHAGIATQAVVEKTLAKQGLSRQELGREEFVRRVWAWKEEYGGRITQQLRSLGGSMDWQRECFTLDEKLSRAVTEAFVRMYESGAIRRDTRLVNWSPALKTAISDIEVDYEELDGITRFAVPGHPAGKEYMFGALISFAYPIAGTDDEIVVSTTRLETMLGDSAVCVHPADPRYTHLHGKRVVHPIHGTELPIVLDAELVDMSFGTGAVKITPAHDANDYALGKKHSLAFVNILNEDGTINEAGGEYCGWPRFEVREALLKRFKDAGLYRGLEPNPGQRLGFCSRSGDIIEPYIKPQWYVDCRSMCQRSMDAVTRDELKIVPDTYKDTWFRWLEATDDWCISRQLWWGHRIPAFFATVNGQPASRSDTANWVVARTVDEARAAAATRFGVAPSAITLEQDDDVLDTWFSSGLFPFSVFGWPDQTDDLAAFYPTTLLETGKDILFFWVARMVMMGLQLTDKLPFEFVFLHSMVRDAHGRKMSKSLGNVIDPIAVIEGISLEGLHETVRSGNLPEKEVAIAIEGQKADFPDGIPACGADALRFGLCAYVSAGRDINLDVDRIVGFRNFAQKVWQATRFSMNVFGEGFTPVSAAAALADDPARTIADRWVLARLAHAIATTTAALESYQFAPAAMAVYVFWWDELCAYYIELAKPIAYNVDSHAAGSPAHVAAVAARDSLRQVLYTCLETGLRLLHPFMPYITEELWQRLPRRPADETVSIMLAPYPEPVPSWLAPDVCAAFAVYQSVLHAGRSLRAQYLKPSDRPDMFVRAKTAAAAAGIAPFEAYLCVLCQAKTITTLAPGDGEPPAECGVSVVSADLDIAINLKGLVDAAKELTKLRKQLGIKQQSLDGLVARMDKPAYAKVPEDQKVKDADKRVETEGEIIALNASIAMFESLGGAAAAGSA